MKVLVTGAAGFIAGYLIEELLENEYEVIGIDNHSKYGELIKSYDQHPNYTFIKGDAKDPVCDQRGY
jgi:UDP-glucose 4-epimerase